jgi:hypothetical protein
MELVETKRILQKEVQSCREYNEVDNILGGEESN